MTKHYLGDGVYITYTGYSLILTTENGITVTNEIHLEDVIIHHLLEFLVRNDIFKELINIKS